MSAHSNSAHSDLSINFDIDSDEYQAYKDKLKGMRERAYYDTLCIIELLQRCNEAPLSYTEHCFRLHVSDIDLDVDFVVCDEVDETTVGEAAVCPIDPATGATYLNYNVGLDSSDIASLEAGSYQLSIGDDEPAGGLSMDEILYFMQAADVGRPSSYANVVEELVANGLIVLSGDKYSLSAEGQALVDCLNTHEPGLINPYFTQALNIAVEMVASGMYSGEDVFNMLLNRCFMLYQGPPRFVLWDDIEECYAPAHTVIPNMIRFGV